MNPIGLCLEPLDVLFFRDGRPFGAATKVVSGLPTPQVLAGAVRTALLEKYGCDFGALAVSTKAGRSFADGLKESIRWIADVRFRGPWLCRLPNPANKIELDVFLPVPATIHTRKKGERVEGEPNVFRLQPLKTEDLPGWNEKLPTGKELRPLWLTETATTEPTTGFINSEGLRTFLTKTHLREDKKVPNETGLRPADDFYGFDTRTGIGIDGATFTAGDGEIYGIRFLSLKPGFGFYADVLLPPTVPADALRNIPVLAFGGEGKRVAVHDVQPFKFPDPPKCEGKQKRFLLLTTPAVTNKDGTPYLPTDCVAAAVNSPVAISGWDIAKNGPKPTRFASPAGSVYFLDSNTDVPESTDEFGYGCHLQGVWTDE